MFLIVSLKMILFMEFDKEIENLCHGHPRHLQLQISQVKSGISLIQSCDDDSLKIWGRAADTGWIHDFVATFGVIDRPIYMALCS